MNRLVGKIIGLLDSDERGLRVAAVRVLGALEVQDKAAMQALHSVLGRNDSKLRIAALKAIASIGAADSVLEIFPLLEESGDVGHEAIEALASVGPKVLTRAKSHYRKAGENGRRHILQLAARLRGAAGMDLIVQAFRDGHAADIADITAKLADEVAAGTTRERNALVRKVDQFLATGSVGSGPGGVAAALDLLARIAGTNVQDRLLEYTGSNHPARVRKRALQALAHVAPRGKLKAQLLGTLLGYLKDDDFAHVVKPAMTVLERAELDAEHEAPLLAHLKGNDPALRRFAVVALGGVDTKKSAAALLDVMRGDNPDLRKRAAESLSRQSAAIALISGALAKAPDKNNAWVLARILHPHDHKLKPEQVKSLASAAAAWLEPGDPRAEAVVTVLRDRYSSELADACIARAKRLKRNRRGGEVVNLLRPLVRDGAELSADARYELAIAEVIRGPRNVAREGRLGHPGLIAMEDLLHEPDFALGTRLKRDKAALEPEEYYLIGCHFAERTYGDKAFGGEILRWIVQTFQDDTSAVAAEHKLHMEGFPPPPKPKPKAKPKRSVPKKTKVAPKTIKSAPARKAVAKRAKKAAPKKKTVSKKTTKAPARKKAPTRKKTAKKAARKKAPARKTKRRR